MRSALVVLGCSLVCAVLGFMAYPLILSAAAHGLEANFSTTSFDELLGHRISTAIGFMALGAAIVASGAISKAFGAKRGASAALSVTVGIAIIVLGLKVINGRLAGVVESAPRRISEAGPSLPLDLVPISGVLLTAAGLALLAGLAPLLVPGIRKDSALR